MRGTGSVFDVYLGGAGRRRNTGGQNGDPDRCL